MSVTMAEAASQSAPPPEAAAALADTGDRVPLVVDLDGTVIKSDTLWEAIFAMVAQRPWLAMLVPVWLLRGRAHLKRMVATRAVLDPAWLPYHEPMVTLIREARDAGRPIVLATATDMLLADPVREHLGVFDHLIASEGGVNKRGQAKVDAIRELLGEGDFDYAGDSDADVALVAAARRTILVNPSVKLRRAAEARGNVATLFDDRPATWRGLLRLMRPHQWVKNVLLLVPLLLAHRADDWVLWGQALAALVSFCLAASSVYVFNDLLDVESDRRHPRKRSRPLAAASVKTPEALGLAMGAIAASLAIAWAGVGWPFVLMVIGYLVFTTLYSTVLKQKVFIDVLTLAWLFTYRILAGAVAVGVVISPWLAVFSVFIFLSLALLKRVGEVREMATGEATNPRRGYRGEDLTVLRTLGMVSGYLSVLVVGQYIYSDAVAELYRTPELLWLVAVLQLHVISRLWLLANRGVLEDDPLVFLVKDPQSLLAAGLAGATIVAATFVEL